jgi:glutamate-1-semialdehyde 2,1-aminomutase
VPHYCVSAGSMFCTFFTHGPVTNLDSAMRSDTDAFTRYFDAMLDDGIYIAPSQYEAGFLSTAHTTRHIERTLAAADGAFTRVLVS